MLPCRWIVASVLEKSQTCCPVSRLLCPLSSPPGFPLDAGRISSFCPCVPSLSRVVPFVPLLHCGDVFGSVFALTSSLIVVRFVSRSPVCFLFSLDSVFGSVAALHAPFLLLQVRRTCHSASRALSGSVPSADRNPLTGAPPLGAQIRVSFLGKICGHPEGQKCGHLQGDAICTPEGQGCLPLCASCPPAPTWGRSRAFPPTASASAPRAQPGGGEGQSVSLTSFLTLASAAACQQGCLS